MKYEKPNMELMKLKTYDVICTSGGLIVEDSFQTPGSGSSTPVENEWPQEGDKDDEKTENRQFFKEDSRRVSCDGYASVRNPVFI